MAPDFVDVELQTDEFRKLLESALATVGDLKPFFQRRLDYAVIGFLRRHFDTKGRYGGTPWAPLRPATKRARLRTRGGNRGGIDHPLWNFGKLRASLIRSTGPDTHKIMDRATYVHGSRVTYGQFHQPTRPFIVQPPKKELTEWERLLARWLETKL